jgi:hypothetical protein
MRTFIYDHTVVLYFRGQMRLFSKIGEIISGPFSVFLHIKETFSTLIKVFFLSILAHVAK